MYKLHLSILTLLLICTPLVGCDIDDMTLEEKVGQLFMAYFDGNCANEQAERLIRETKLGGIIYYNWSNELKEPSSVLKMSNDLQKLAKHHIGIPLFIAIDQEGGLVTRLSKGFTEFPGNAALGRTEQSDLAYQASNYMGKELKAVGVNFNLAPVIDINNNSKNPVIGIRSFSDRKEQVADFGGKSLKGFKESGVIPCLKHFPGHGDVWVDSHKALPIVNKSYQELENFELYPFIELVEAAPAIMTAHILFPQIDSENCATLSSHFLKEILRKKLNFKGVLLTDSLTMSGVLEGHDSLEEVAIKAFEAGNDILLIGGQDLQNQMDGESHIDEVIGIYHNMIKAVKEGKISEERLNASVSRILKLKKEYGLYAFQAATKQDLEKTLQSKKHTDLAREIAYRCVDIKKWDPSFDLSKSNIAILAPKILHDNIQTTDLLHLGKDASLYLFEDLEPSSSERLQLLENVKDYDSIIFISYNAWEMPNQQKLLHQVANLKPTVWIASRDPYDLDIDNSSIIKIATYSPTSSSLQVVADYLGNKTSPLVISNKQAEEIGHKIWFNECRNRLDQLTFWSENEPFPSVGIGHFIWPPKSYNGVFSRGRFHSVLEFFEENKIEVPTWLSKMKFSPWSTREEFYREFNSERMSELRSFLKKTLSYQALYMVKRLNRSFRDIVLATPSENRKELINQFFRVGRTPDGPYILVDYLNFKHEGTDKKERYKGRGWGMLQVLSAMPSLNREQDIDHDLPPNQRFAEAAKAILIERIHNSPHPQKEQQWLPGWENRLKTYYKSEKDRLPCGCD